MEKEVIPFIGSYIEEAKFPDFLVPKVREAGFLKHCFKAPYGSPISTAGTGLMVAEWARGDASFATFLLVQAALLGYTVEALGS